MNADDLGTAADELYALPPAEFVAARTAMEKAARAAGRRDLATAIRALAKPSAAAGLTNRLARAHPDEIRALLDLGDEMRAATEARDGAGLRELSTRRNRQVAHLLGLARQLAAADGGKVTDDTARGVEDSLRSAVADPAAGELLAAGRLTDVLEQSGFPGLFAPEPGPPPPARERSAPPTAKAKSSSKADDGKTDTKKADTGKADTGKAEAARREAAARRLAEAAGKLDAARADAESAAAALDDARALADARAAEAEELAAEAVRLREELERVQAARERAVGHERRAQAQLATAERAARAAERRLADAAEAHARLPAETS